MAGQFVVMGTLLQTPEWLAVVHYMSVLSDGFTELT